MVCFALLCLEILSLNLNQWVHFKTVSFTQGSWKAPENTVWELNEQGSHLAFDTYKLLFSELQSLFLSNNDF